MVCVLEKGSRRRGDLSGLEETGKFSCRRKHWSLEGEALRGHLATGETKELDGSQAQVPHG